MKKILPFLPLVLIVLAMLYVYLSGVYHDFSFDSIRLKHTDWKQRIHDDPFRSAVYFILFYTISVCLVIPDSIFLSILGGFLFPFPLAVFYIVVSETLGATLLFIAAELALKKMFSKTATGYLNTLEKKLGEKQVHYLLFLRFSHLLPYWVVNMTAAILKIPKRTFIWTTCIGVLPLAIILAQAGSELSHYFDQQALLSIDDLFTVKTKIILIGLGLLTLLPLRLRRRSNRPLA